MATTKKSKTIEVQAFACTMCHSVHAEREAAEECCSCNVCHGQFLKRSSYSSVCDGCCWGQDVRSSRADVRRYTEQLKNAEERLAKLLAKKPPKAGKAAS